MVLLLLIDVANNLTNKNKNKKNNNNNNNYNSSSTITNMHKKERNKTTKYMLMHLQVNHKISTFVFVISVYY